MDVVNISNFRREIYSAEIRMFEQNAHDESTSVYMLQVRHTIYLMLFEIAYEMA